jgi:lysine 6-dehydrogenase
MGVAPGLTNVLAAEAIRRLDSTAELRMYVGGLPENPRPPLNYQIVFSLEGSIDYLTTPSWILSEGRLKQQEPLSDLELLKFEGLGTLEAQIMGAIRDLGLLSDDPVTVAQQEIVPRDVFIAAATPQLIRPGEPDLVVLRVVAKGERAGETKVLTWNLVDREDPETGITAMMRCTGFTLSIVGLLIGRGVIDETGVLAPDEGIPYESVVEELDKRGVRIAFEETAG